MAALGSAVKALREEKGWTQTRLAAEAGVRPSAISLLEGGQRSDVRANLLARIARALGVTSDAILIRAGLLPPTDANMEAEIAALRQGDPLFEDIYRNYREMRSPVARRALAAIARTLKDEMVRDVDGDANVE